MKVAVLTHTYPRFPGDPNAPFVEQLMEQIASKGLDVSVLTAWDPEWRRTKRDHNVDLRTYRYIHPDSLHILGYSRTIEGNIRFRKRMLFLSPFLFYFGEKALGKLVNQKKPDIIHAHWILPNGYMASSVAKKKKIPLLIQLHGSDVFTAEKNFLFRKMALAAAKRATYIISPSPNLSERLINLGVDPSKLGIVPNAVDSSFSTDVKDSDVSQLRDRLGVGDDKMILLAMGRMVHVKGFTYLIEAFQKVARKKKDVVLVLAGGGVLYNDLRDMADESGFGDRIIMPGTVMRDEVPVYFRMGDLFVIPSVRHESGAVDGLPVVVPEAMAAGLPIIATDAGGISLLVKDKWNGRIVPQKDPESLAAAMLEIVDNTDEMKIYGLRSRKLVEETVNYDSVANYLIKLYSSIISGVNPTEFPKFELRIEN